MVQGINAILELTTLSKLPIIQSSCLERIRGKNDTIDPPLVDIVNHFRIVFTVVFMDNTMTLTALTIIN